MHARTSWRIVLAAVGLAAAAGAGCGDDDDVLLRQEQGGSGSPVVAHDAGPRVIRDAGPLDASMSLDELGFEGSTLASALSISDAEQLCHKLDEVGGLLDNLQLACTVEAYLITFDAKDCESIVSQCTHNGHTVLGLELPLGCSQTPTVLTGCDAPLSEVLGCAGALGNFWLDRACETGALSDLGPTCTEALASSCPLLFGSPNSQ